MADVIVSDVYKSFAGVTALAGVSLHVRHGSIAAVLGPSGCGKTTLLRTIAGFERPDRGHIALGGRTVVGDGVWVAPERRGVGMVFQDYALFPHLTVAENIGFGLRTSAPERARRVSDLLALVDLRGTEDRYPHELSGGQQQRVALARALAPRPQVLLLDEPFSHLDARLRSQMRDELGRILRQEGMTAILVTHDQREAFAISDQVAVMRQGVIEQAGTPRAVYLYPATKFVASFVGATNLLEGRVSSNSRGSGGGATLITEMGVLPCPLPVGRAPDGSAVTVCVRPEYLQLDPGGPFTGRVLAVTFTGEVNELVLGVRHDGKECRILLYAPATAEVRVGQTVRFGIVPERVTLIGLDDLEASVTG